MKIFCNYWRWFPRVYEVFAYFAHCLLFIARNEKSILCFIIQYHTSRFTGHTLERILIMLHKTALTGLCHINEYYPDCGILLDIILLTMYNSNIKK